MVLYYMLEHGEITTTEVWIAVGIIFALWSLVVILTD